jgi:hypothetical protein
MQGCLFIFPWSLITQQLDVVCVRDISFKMDYSWMNWTLKIQIVLAIMVNTDFSWT